MSLCLGRSMPVGRGMCAAMNMWFGTSLSAGRRMPAVGSMSEGMRWCALLADVCAQVGACLQVPARLLLGACLLMGACRSLAPRIMRDAGLRGINQHKRPVLKH